MDDVDPIEKLFVPDDGVTTRTSVDQSEVEQEVLKFNRIYKLHPEYRFGIKLKREKHIKYLMNGLRGLGSGYSSLDASRPWLIYWIVHSLSLLGHSIDDDLQERIIDFLGVCQDPDGGFAGGPGQVAHLAPTYASLNTLVCLGTTSAYQLVNREKMLRFLLSLKEEEGGFIMHKDGESDVRGTYCAIVVASYLNLLTPEITEKVPEYIKSCQTYEGGIGGCPGNEAHGGYAFCAMSAVSILNRLDVLDLHSLLQWAVSRQLGFEGGFQGRTNKLVDSCYSFWQGAIFHQIGFSLSPSLAPKTPLVEDNDPACDDPKLKELNDYIAEEATNHGEWLFDQRALQEYVMVSCQTTSGGLKDKPGKSRDYYHSCYALSGISVAQHNSPNHPHPHTVIGSAPGNLLEEVHPAYGVLKEKVEKAINYWKTVPDFQP